jgi:hypothetical protein
LKKFDLIFFSEIGVMWFLDFSGINSKKAHISGLRAGLAKILPGANDHN